MTNKEKLEKLLKSGSFKERNEKFLRAITADYDQNLIFSNSNKNEKNKIHINPVNEIFSDLDEVGNVMGVRGLISQRAFHKLYSDFRQMKKLKNFKKKNSPEYQNDVELLEILEDKSVESAGVYDFPGLKHFVNLVNDKMAENLPSEVVAETSISKIVAYKNAIWKKINGFEVGSFKDKKLQKAFDDSLEVLEESKKTKTTKERVELANKLSELSKGFLEEALENDQQTSMDNQKGQDMDENNTGEGKETSQDSQENQESKGSKKSKEKSEGSESGEGEASESDSGEGKENGDEDKSSKGEKGEKNSKDQENSSEGSDSSEVSDSQEGDSSDSQEGDSSDGSDSDSQQSDSSEGQDGSSDGNSESNPEDSDSNSEGDGQPGEDKGELSRSHSRDVDNSGNPSKGPIKDTDLKADMEKSKEQEKQELESEKEDLEKLREEIENELNEIKDEISRTSEDADRKGKSTDSSTESLKDIDYGKMHQDIQVREHKRLPGSKDRYNVIRKSTDVYSRNLSRKIQNLLRYNLEEKRTGEANGYLDTSNLFRKDGKIFSQRKDKNDESELVIMLLVDESGSMGGSRAKYARDAAILLAEVCEKLNIPLAVLGHTAQFGNKVVDMRHYIGYEKSIAEQKHNLSEITSRQDNRDGLALKYAGEYLSKQPQKDKLMLVIADGEPAHGYDRYYGKHAIADCQNVIKDLTKKGIVSVGVAIGDGQDEIESIFKNFISINQLEKLPNKLIKVIEKRIFKN